MKLMYMTEEIAELQKDEVSGDKVIRLKDGIEEYKIPRELFFNTNQVEWERFMSWLEQRVFSQERCDLDALLGGSEFNVLNIVKETKASLATDDYWVKINDDDQFEDTIRYFVIRLMECADENGIEEIG